VELRGTVWIPNPDGTTAPLPLPIRGLSQDLENVPIRALAWNGSPSLARLNLQGVLSQGEFNRLTGNPELIYALTRMQFEPSNSTTMDVKVKSSLRQ
jgi:hypothetical protein